VQYVNVTAMSGSAIVVHWDPSDNPNGEITGYNVTYFQANMVINVRWHVA